MSLADIVSVTITSNSRGISRVGFGTALVVGYHNHWPELTREYSLGTAVVDLVADGFNIFDPIVRAVIGLASNTPKSKKVLISRIPTVNDVSDEFGQESDMTVKDIDIADDGPVFGFTVIDHLGVSTAISYVAQGGDGQDEIATALAALADAAMSDVTVGTDAGPTIEFRADNGNEMFYVENYDLGLFDYIDTTNVNELAGQLAVIAADNNNWYTLILSGPPSADRIGASVQFIETQEKIFISRTYDTGVGDVSVTDDIMSGMQSANVFRSAAIFSTDQSAYSDAGWAGGRLPLDPGGSTWAFKTISGTRTDELTNAFSSSVFSKNGSTYESIASIGVTQGAKMGSGEFIDVVRGRDWLTQRLRERIFVLLANAPKIPFTNAGIDQVKAQVEAQLNEGIGAGYLSSDPEPPFEVTAPLASEVSSIDKANRLLPDVAFTATLAGAIHATEISGTLLV